MNKFDKQKVENLITELLEAFGEDTSREGLLETPGRVARYWEELLEGSQYTNEEIAKMYSKTFLVNNDSLVVKEVRDVYSHCEHHLALMYNMRVIVAYLPVKQGSKYKVIGLSKIPRIVNMCAKRLQLQEKLAKDIADCLSLATGSPDIYVNIRGDHACVSARGAKSDGVTDVTVMTGRMKSDPMLRDEIERKVLP